MIQDGAGTLQLLEHTLMFSFSELLQVKVLFAGQDIDKSPFLVNVAKALGDPSKVQARGPGLEPVGNVTHKPTYFDIYTAGESQTQREKRDHRYTQRT